MAPFDRKYTDPQRESIWRAWREEDHSPSEIVERAGAGHLADPDEAGKTLPPFDLVERSARDMIARRLMKEVRAGSAGGGAPIAEIAGRLVAVAQAEANRLATVQKDGKLDAKNFREFVRSIIDLNELQKRASTRPRRGEGESESEESESSPLASELATAAAEEGDNASPDSGNGATSSSPESTEAEIRAFRSRAEKVARPQSDGSDS